MMRLPAAIALLVVFGTWPVHAADDQPRDVLAQAIKAHGGAEYLTKNQAGTSSGQGKMNIPGVGDIQFNKDTSFMLPDKFKETISMQIAGQNINVITIANGQNISIELNGKKVDVDDASRDSLKDAGHLLTVGHLVGLAKEKDYELSLIGEEKVEGKPAIGIRVVSKGKKDVSLYFDKQSHLLAKMECRTMDPFTKGEVSEERIILEYMKNKDDVSVAKKVIIKHDGKSFLEFEASDVQMLEKIDDGEFKKP